MYRIRPSIRPLRTFPSPATLLRPNPSLRISPVQRNAFQTSARLSRQAPFRRLGQQQQYKRFGNSSGGVWGLLYRWAARPTFYRDVGLITAGAGGVYVFNLETVPVSGRRRFNIISPSLEEMMGKASVDQVREEYRGRILPEYDPRVQRVRRVLQRLLPYAEGEGLRDLDWEVTVIDSPEENAFVAPGGKVFVFTGILPLCRDDDGIAAVLGHEIAHVVAHHTAERMSRAPLILMGALLLSTLDISFYSSKMLLDLFLSMPASRKHEAEADYIGLLMMAQGCYKPEAAMEFWNRMEKAGSGGPPELLSTHPSNHNREEKIREWLPQALEMADKSDCAGTAEWSNQFSSAFDGFRRWG